MISRMLRGRWSIAVVGTSIKPARPSLSASRYLQPQGYRILPVNPGYACRAILGEPIAAGLDGLTGTPDMVAISCRPEHAGAIGREAAARGARCT